MDWMFISFGKTYKEEDYFESMTIKKIFEGVFDEGVHSDFLKFGRGEYKNKFLLEGKRQGWPQLDAEEQGWFLTALVKLYSAEKRYAEAIALLSEAEALGLPHDIVLSHKATVQLSAGEAEEAKKWQEAERLARKYTKEEEKKAQEAQRLAAKEAESEAEEKATREAEEAKR